MNLLDYKIIIGLPAYNEENVLPELLDKFRYLRKEIGNSLDVLVVNDGSSDSTENILNDYASRYPYIHYISHLENRGLGEAVKTIFGFVLENYDKNDVLITLDADNTHNPRIIPAMINKLKKENLNLVIASRFAQGAKEIGLSLDRKIYSRGATYLLRLFYPISNVRDYSCGYRAYELAYLQKAIDLYQGDLITTSGFECMAEILARFSRIGVAAGEYPLELHYEMKKSKSKMKVTRTIMGYFRLLGRIKKPLYH